MSINDDIPKIHLTPPQKRVLATLARLETHPLVHVIPHPYWGPIKRPAYKWVPIKPRVTFAALKRKGLIERETERMGGGIYRHSYRLTDKGREAAQR